MASPAKGLVSGKACSACGVSQLSALPSERPPSRSLHGDQAVLCAGKARPREAQQHAAVLHPRRNQILLSRPARRRCRPVPAWKGPGRARLQGLGIGRLAHVAIGFKGARARSRAARAGVGRSRLTCRTCRPMLLRRQRSSIRKVAAALRSPSISMRAISLRSSTGKFDDALQPCSGRPAKIRFGFAEARGHCRPGRPPWRRALRHRPHAVR